MLEKQTPPGNIIAHDVPFDEWMEKYAEDHTEWVEGGVIKLSPVTEDHDGLFRFFIVLLEFFLAETRLGIVRAAPFVMKIKPKTPGREPDLQIVLNKHMDIVQPTLIAGAPDIIIEIVSQESIDRDYETKFLEYQAAGVAEYWLIDPIYRKSLFYHLDGKGQYQPIELVGNIFESKVLTGFRLDTRLLWQKPLPVGKQITALVDSMLKKDE